MKGSKWLIGSVIGQILRTIWAITSAQIGTQLMVPNIYGRYLDDVLKSALHHHHQNTKSAYPLKSICVFPLSFIFALISHSIVPNLQTKCDIRQTMNVAFYLSEGKNIIDITHVIKQLHQTDWRLLLHRWDESTAPRHSTPDWAINKWKWRYWEILHKHRSTTSEIQLF